MKYLYLVALFVLYSSGGLLAQIPNSLSIGGGINYPYSGDYDLSWFTSVHWNIRVSKSVSVDTHLDLAEIGVKDYADAPGVENDNQVYQLGTGLRYHFMKRFFVRGGISAAIVNYGEAGIRIFPDTGIGINLFLKKRHGLEISLKNDLIRNFDYHNYISIFSLGAAYKFRYPVKEH